MNGPTLLKKLFFIISISFIGASMSACGNSTSWKEEVLLHDGKRLIVERSISYDPKGNREIGQSAPKSEETLQFTLPGNSQNISWKSDFGQELQDNLDLLALEIVDGKPYIVTIPSRCHAYNKWGRPNPPYVFFKHDGQVWQRIPIAELPKEVTRANVVIGGYGDSEKGQLRGMGIDVKQTKPYVTAEIVERFNGAMSGDPRNSLMQVFIRAPLKDAGTDCQEMVYYKGSWVGPGDSIGRRMMDRKTQ